MKTLVVLPLVTTFALGPLIGAQQSPASTTAATASTAIAPATAVNTTGPDANGRYMLREGEDVPLKFAQDISSKTAADGDPVTFTLADDLKVGNVIVARKAARLSAK